MNKLYFKRQISYHKNTFLFLLPWLFVFVTFSVYPIIYSFYLSFTKFRASGVRPPKWVGFKNYIKLLEDEHFINSAWNSFYFVLGTVPITLFLAIALAVFLNQKIRFRTFYRVSYFIPVVTSLFVIATLFKELYAPGGLFNQALGLLGIEGKHWLKNPDWALSSVMLMNIWASFGFYTLMLLAGLQNIPKEYYEASSIEGATKFRQFHTITLPLLKPTILVACLINSIFAFQIFGEIFILTQGGPLRSTETSVYYLYVTGFHKQKMGYASAAGYWIFIALVLFSILQYWALRQKNRSETNN